MIGGFTFLGYNPVDLEPLLESGGTWDPIVPKPLSGTRALSDHLERERLHLTFLSCHWAAARLLGLGRRGNLLAKRQGGVWPAGAFWEGGLQYSPCLGLSLASSYHELPHRPLVGPTGASTPMGLPATVLEPNDACAGLGWGGSDRPSGRSSGPGRQTHEKAPGLPEGAVTKHSHTEQTSQSCSAWLSVQARHTASSIIGPRTQLFCEAERSGEAGPAEGFKTWGPATEDSAKASL